MERERLIKEARLAVSSMEESLNRDSSKL